MDKLTDKRLKEVEREIQRQFLRRRKELRENELSKNSKQKCNT